VGFVGPVPFSTVHDLDLFDCGSDELSHWLKERALTNQLSGASRTWVVTEHGRVVAFYSSASASIVRSEASGAIRRNQPNLIPAVLLSRLAVDVRSQGRGLGAALLNHFMLKALEVNQMIGVRVVVVHAQDENAVTFYQRYGFSPSPIAPLTLMQFLPKNPTFPLSQ
jgi:GNAT superfamily N-acetyltransferase